MSISFCILRSLLKQFSVLALLFSGTLAFGQLIAPPDVCFPSIGEAMLSNSERSIECAALGGDASGLQIVPNSEEGLWCLEGECDVSSDSSGTDTQICKSTADELIGDMASLIFDCTYEQPDNSHNFNIEYFKDNPLESAFCITGECKSEKESSSSSEEISSSSSEESSSSSSDFYYGSSCQIPNNEWQYLSGYGVFKKTLYSDYPGMQNASDIWVSSCACGVDNFFRCTVNNFGYVHDYTVFGLSLCGFSHGYWCSGIEKGSCDFLGKSAYIYYSDNNGWLVESVFGGNLYPFGTPSSNFTLTNLTTKEEIVMFEHKYILPLGVSTSDIENAILEALPDFPSLNKLNEYCRGEWVPHDEDCFGTEQEVETALGDSVYFCSSLGGKTSYSKELSSRGWCVVGECEFDDISSSSEEVSSSSSESSNCPSHPLSSVPSNPLSACFEKNGTCYKCNSARGNECSNNWLWIYDFVPGNVGWWYSEVDCNSGSDNYSSSSEVSSSSNYESSSSSESTDIGYPGSSGSSICPSHPLASVPPNPLEACFEKNGTCYKCNSARGNECSNNWLWIYDFVPGNVGWWYEEVSCEEEKNECPDGTGINTFLSKNSVFETEEETSDYDISYEIWGNKTKFYYDAIGRKTQNDPDTRRYLFAPKGNTFVREERYAETGLLKVMPDGSKCGEIGIDHGILLENGQRKGGVTCYYFDVSYSYPKSNIKTSLIEKPGCTCGENLKFLKVEGELYYSLNLLENEIYYVPENYRFSDSYIATKSDVEAIRKHELKHWQDNIDIISNVEGRHPIDTIVCENEFNSAFRTQIGEKLISEKKIEYNEKIKAASDIFHKNCGLAGFCE